MTPIEPRTLERFSYWQGQRLRSSDFRQQFRIADQKRWWHHRAVHGGAGVSFGFKAILGANGNGEPCVTVSCGVAYDCFGRELVLQKPRCLPVPDIGSAGEKTVVLLASRRPPAEASCCESRPESDFLCSGKLLWEDAVEFSWKESRDLSSLDGVPLIYLGPDNNVWRDLLQGDNPERFFVPHVRPIARPRLATGRTLPGAIVWEPWIVGGATVGVQTRVDTAAAGFSKVPLYHASLSTTKTEGEAGHFLPYFLTHVAAPRSDGFLLRVLLQLIPRKMQRAVAGFGQSIKVADVEDERHVAVFMDDVSSFHPGDVIRAGDENTTAVPGGDFRILDVDRVNNRLIFDRSAESVLLDRRLELAPLSRRQNRLRLEDVTGLTVGDRLILYAPEAAAGRPSMTTVTISRIYAEISTVELGFESQTAFEEVPSRIQIMVPYNPGFLFEFTPYARLQELFICWMACGGELPEPKPCPGQVPQPHPCDNPPTEEECSCHS